MGFDCHAYQRTKPADLLWMTPEVKPLVIKILKAVDDNSFSYQQKETALHIANEELFHGLITRRG